MFQTTIDLQTFADLFERMTEIHQSNTGPTMVTHARHPELGSCVVVQGYDDDLIMMSQLPISAV